MNRYRLGFNRFCEDWIDCLWLIETFVSRIDQQSTNTQIRAWSVGAVESWSNVGRQHSNSPALYRARWLLRPFNVQHTEVNRRGGVIIRRDGGGARSKCRCNLRADSRRRALCNALGED